MHIIKHPDPRLKERSKEVELKELKSPTTQKLIDEMIETMWQADGIGIAGVQVGELTRIAVITHKREALVLINPVLKKSSWRKDTMEEGCLSLPGFYGPVKRPRRVRIKALNRQGQEVDLRAEGLTARIIQHELDHLNGTLYIDRCKKVHSVEPTARL